MRIVLPFLVAVLVAAHAAVAFAGQRVALIIGNSEYSHTGRLPNPVNDAADIAASFERLGFEVRLERDLSFSAMRRALGAFSRQAVGAEMAVIFFAGHGMEVNKQNYLIPTDAELSTDLSISYEAIPLELVTEAVSTAKGLKLVMLDACRNNPFAAQMEMTSATRSIGRGLARVEPVAGTLVSFAAKEGTVASDGRGRNSPYTKALLAHLEQPGLEINFLFRRVRDAVMDRTSNQQQPFTYGSLPGSEIYLVDPVKDSSDTTDDDRVAALEKELDLLRQKLEQGLAQPKPETGDNQQGQSEVLTPDQMHSRGATAAKAKRYEEALEWFERAAKLGHDKAAVGAGRILYNGSAGQTDHKRAFRYFRQAADADNARGANWVGFLYNNGEGVSADVKEAVRWYERAVELGNATAAGNLARKYYSGKGVEQDHKKAAELYKIAAEGTEHVNNFTGYGWVLFNGQGVERDEKEAIKWFEKSAAEEEPYALANLGIAYLNGRGVEKDRKKALQYFERSAKHGHPRADYFIGLMLDGGFDVAADYKRAARAIARSLEGGYELAVSEMTKNSNAWNKTFRIELQRILKDENVYTGSLDGSFGPQTISAIRKYAGKG